MVIVHPIPGSLLGNGGNYCAYAPYNAIPLGESRSEVLYQNQGVHNEQHETSFQKVQVKAQSISITTTAQSNYRLVPNESYGESTPLLRSGMVGPDYIRWIQPWHEFMPEPANLQRLLDTYKCTRRMSLSYWAYLQNYEGLHADWYHLYFPVTPKSERGSYVVVHKSLGVLKTTDVTKAYIEATAKLSSSGLPNAKVDYIYFDRLSVTQKGGDIPSQWFDLDFVQSAIASAKDVNVPYHLRNECQGEALLGAVSQAQVTDVFNFENIIELVGVLKDPSSVLSDIIGLVSPVKGKKQALKRLADAKLTYDYSVKTTYSDVETLKSDLRAYLRDNNDRRDSIARGRSSFTRRGVYGQFQYRYRCQEAYKVFYGPVSDSLLPLYRGLQNIGADPSFEHVWNVIPYSFVVDWLYPVSKLFEQIDYETNVATLPVHAVTHGKWETHSFSNEWLKVDVSTFNRRLSNEMPDFPYFLPSFSPNMNWWNAGALIIQRVR